MFHEHNNQVDSDSLVKTVMEDHSHLLEFDLDNGRQFLRILLQVHKWNIIDNLSIVWEIYNDIRAWLWIIESRQEMACVYFFFQMSMADYAPLTSMVLKLLFRHFNQYQVIIIRISFSIVIVLLLL